MDPARRRANRFSHILQKSDDVVICPLFDLKDLGNRKSRSLPNFSSVLFRDLTQLRHRLAGEHFDLQPNLELAFVRPDFAHLWPRITVNHSGKINWPACSKSVLFLLTRCCGKSAETADATAVRLVNSKTKSL